MAVLIEEVTMAKSQKSLRVKLSGSWYGAYLDSGLNAPHLKGTTVEAEIVTLDKGGPWIKAWKPTNAAPQAAQSTAQTSPTPAAAAPYKYAEPSDNVQPWFMPFVSNTVAHAITAGHCQSPVAINEWALKAAQVAVAIKEQVK